MSETNNNQAKQPTKSNSDLKNFEKLIGTWEVSGGVEGKITFEWAEGGFFLVQKVDLTRDWHSIKKIEIIGRERKFGEELRLEIRSRHYGFNDGATFDYVYKMEGNDLTIRGGEKNSPGFMKGEISGDGQKMTAEWTYPGGGYQTSGVKIS